MNGPVRTRQDGLSRRAAIAAGGAALAALLASRIAVAQDATPPAGGFEIAPGVMAEPLAWQEGRDEPALYRLTLEPGTVYPFTPAPGIALVYCERGALTLTLDALATVTRAGSTNAPGEAFSAGSQFTIQPGDFLVLPSLVSGEIRNDGQEPAAVVVADVLPTAAPVEAETTPIGQVPEAATPAP